MDGKKKVLTEDDAQEMLERYYQRPLFEATVLLKLARRQVGNKNVAEMLEAMRVVFLSDISIKLNNLVDGLDEFEKRPRAPRHENGQRSGEPP